jgi:DNA (cytosine-5)-methyltransferase 1
MGLTIGSLFSGIGGLELGLEWAGLGPVVWQVEKDEYCRRVLAKHWPDATRYEDVRDVGSRNLAAVDVLAGGFPCQDVSVTGFQAGIVEGSRSGLWIEFARIVGELRPRYVVVENVTGLLADGMGRVLGELSRLGYDAEWSTVSACAVGAPHTRERVFIVAYPARGERETRVRHQPDGPRPLQLRNGGTVSGDRAPAWVEDVAALYRSADGIPHRVDRVTALGNAVVPQVAEVVGRVILELESRVTHQPASTPAKAPFTTPESPR